MKDTSKIINIDEILSFLRKIRSYQNKNVNLINTIQINTTRFPTMLTYRQNCSQKKKKKNEIVDVQRIPFPNLLA